MNRFRKIELHISLALIGFLLFLWPFISTNFLESRRNFFFYFMGVWVVLIIFSALIGNSSAQENSKDQNQQSEKDHV